METNRHHDATHARDRETGATSLARLDDMHDFEIADGEPDIRGWSVKSADGTEVGKVTGLIADRDALEVRYIEVQAKRDLVGTDEDDYLLIPIGAARLNDDEDTVTVDRLRTEGMRSAPRFGRLLVITSAQDQSLRDHYMGSNASATKDEHNRFFGNRRQGRDQDRYLRPRSR